ncbi:hypothetical protein ASwh1_395 [Aeromonas phage Aswh_1]|nr:hypothetical protein ASwh1_395 [Aeromonas phage Aswh_1]
MYIRFDMQDFFELLQILNIGYYETRHYDGDIGFTEMEYRICVNGVNIVLLEPSYKDFVTTANETSVEILKGLADTHKINYEMKEYYF